MKSRPWVLPAFSSAVLLGLIATSGYWTMRRARAIHDEMDEVHGSYRTTDTLLQSLNGDIYAGELLARDYLLEASTAAPAVQRDRIEALRRSVAAGLNRLEQSAGQESPPELQQLKVEVESYWQTVTPIFEWTPEQRKKLGLQFLREKVLPRRNQVIALADRLTELNEADLRKDQQRLEASQDSFQRFLKFGLLGSVLLGAVVAALAIRGFVRMEARAEAHLHQIEHAQLTLRQLSRRLVQTQEGERKFISRELHDAVGQALTAIGMELGSLETLRTSPQEFTQRVEEMKRLNGESLRVIRDLAMGLRPSMLDDIGLAPALDWLGRQVSRSSSIPVTVQVSGDPDGLPEPYRTCVYRSVQEALNNCARHSRAKGICVTVDLAPGSLTATVEDDGVGFDAEGPRSGIGLLGIQERVEELDGQLTVLTKTGKGTKLTLSVPLPQR